MAEPESEARVRTTACRHCQRTVRFVRDRGGRWRMFDVDPLPVADDPRHVGWAVLRSFTRGAVTLTAVPVSDLADRILAHVLQVLMLHVCREFAQARYWAEIDAMGLAPALETIFGGGR